MRARWSTICLSLCIGAAAFADDVPPPPAESGLAPDIIFGDDSSATPMPGGDGTITPNAAMNSTPRRVVYAPANTLSSGFPFAGYNTGFTMAVGGTIDELFNSGLHLGVETGYQVLLPDSMFNSVGFTIGLTNQTLFGKDQRSIVLPDGTFRGLETLSLNTFKFGAYGESTLFGIDFYTGVYGKVGAAVLNEDIEFFDPFTEYTPIESYNTEALVGGVGVEAGVALIENEKSSLSFMAGVEYLYVGTFDNPSASTQLFLTSGLQWEFDITDGLFPGRDRSPRQSRSRGGRGRRGRR